VKANVTNLDKIFWNVGKPLYHFYNAILYVVAVLFTGFAGCIESIEKVLDFKTMKKY